ncbi:MAG: murein biosynthesis integral membrane protein MurJ, partial [Planctomycetota bacterium]
HGRFFVPAFAPVLLNVAWMAGIAVAWFALPGEPPLQALVVAGSVIVGATLGWLHHLVPLRRIMRAAGVANAEERLRPVLDLRDRDMRTIFSRMGPTLLGLGLLQVSVLIDNLIAEAFVAGDGAVSALYYGNRLMQFPLALIGTAMGIAVFPVLARHISRGELVSFRRALTDCTRITLFLAIPASVGLVVLAGPLVEVLFRRGAFEASAQARTAAVVAFYGLGVIAACVRMLQTRAFFALGDTRTPVRIAVQMTVLNLVGNIILVQTPLQEAGLALSTAVTTTLSCVALSWKLRRMDGASTAPPGEFASLVRSVVRSCLAAGIMAAGVIPAAAALGGVEGGWRAFGSLGRVAVLGGLVAVAIGVFLVAARLLRAPELRELLRRGR